MVYKIALYLPISTLLMDRFLALSKHYARSILSQALAYIQTLVSHLMVYPIDQKVLALCTMLLTILVVCTPFALYNPNPLSGNASSYIYMIRNLSFLKIACIMLVHTAILWVRHLDMRYQHRIAKAIWYTGEPIGISCALFVIGGCIYTTMIDMIVYMNTYSQTLTVTVFGYMTYVVYIGSIAYSVWRLVHIHVPHHTGRVVWFAQTKAPATPASKATDAAHVSGLFADTQ
jgi:hypothetical protein